MVKKYDLYDFYDQYDLIDFTILLNSETATRYFITCSMCFFFRTGTITSDRAMAGTFTLQQRHRCLCGRWKSLLRHTIQFIFSHNAGEYGREV